MIVKPGHVYRHFKGRFYMVLCIAHNTETDESLVIYKALYGNYDIWARPLEMFTSKVSSKKDNPTGQIYRFEEYDYEW